MNAVDHRHRFFAYGLFVLALGLAVNSLLGPLATTTIRYRYSDSMINQAIGLDAVALFAVAPIAVVAGWLILRGHLAGPVIGFVPTTFAAYMAPQYMVGPDYLGLDGNNEQFFVFHLALFVLSGVLAIGAWSTVERSQLQPATRASDRRRSLILAGVVIFILFRWVPALIELTGGDPSSDAYIDNPTAFVLIGVLDLGFVAPAAIAATIGIRRGAQWGREATYAVIGWFALVPVAVAAMAITMQVNDDPNAAGGVTVLLVAAAVVFTLGAVLLFAPLFRAGEVIDEPAASVPKRPEPVR